MNPRREAFLWAVAVWAVAVVPIVVIAVIVAIEWW